jgi:hypothetical protein
MRYGMALKEPWELHSTWVSHMQKREKREQGRTDKHVRAQKIDNLGLTSFCVYIF